jgi:hypothetical protein
METTTKTNEVFQRANELRLLETRNLVNALIRYNDHLMEDCSDYHSISENQRLADHEKIAIYHRFIKDIQERSFEVSTILEHIRTYHDEVEDFLGNDLYELKVELTEII